MYVHFVPTTFAQRADFGPRTDANRALTDQRVAERFGRPGAATTPPTPDALPVNAYADGEAFKVEALLPGISPEDVRVTIEQGVLTLAATRHGLTPASAPHGQVWYAYEFAPGAVSRALRLPFPVDVEGITAAFTNGLLTITAPKAAAAKARTIAIGGGQQQEQLPAPASS